MLWIYPNVFTYFPIDDRLDSFQILDATNDDALTILILDFFETYVFLLLDKYAEEKFLSHVEIHI